MLSFIKFPLDRYGIDTIGFRMVTNVLKKRSDIFGLRI